MVQFLSNELFLWLMTDSDYGLLVPADMMDREVIPHTEKFSDWNGWGAKITATDSVRQAFGETVPKACRMPVLDASGQETTIYRQRGTGNIASRWRT